MTLRILVACEFSGIVRNAFCALGHDAWSCDILPSELPGNHYECDVREILSAKQIHWDMMVAFPPCTHLASSGARWFAGKQREQLDALDFVFTLASQPIPKIAIENPIGILSTKWRKPDQIIQPHMFGHGETKATCLWLRNLPLLRATNNVSGRHARVWLEPPSPERWKNRSRTYTGIAAAMAKQWGAPSQFK